MSEIKMNVHNKEKRGMYKDGEDYRGSVIVLICLQKKLSELNVCTIQSCKNRRDQQCYLTSSLIFAGTGANSGDSA